MADQKHNLTLDDSLGGSEDAVNRLYEADGILALLSDRPQDQGLSNAAARSLIVDVRTYLETRSSAVEEPTDAPAAEDVYV